MEAPQVLQKLNFKKLLNKIFLFMKVCLYLVRKLQNTQNGDHFRFWLLHQSGQWLYVVVLLFSKAHLIKTSRPRKSIIEDQKKRQKKPLKKKMEYMICAY